MGNDDVSDLRLWFDGKGRSYTNAEMKDTLRHLIDTHGYRIFVGTDSHKAGKKRHAANIIFATALCLWNDKNPRGGFYFYTRNTRKRKEFTTLHARLIHEVQKSLEIAAELEDSKFEIVQIHIDANQSEVHASSKSAKTLASYATGYGFDYRLKPDDPWAANAVADKHAR